MSWQRTVTGKASAMVPMREIVGKQRPRLDARSGRVYTPAKTRNAEQAIREAWIAENGYRYADFDGIVHVAVTSSRPLAKSNPRFWVGRADTGKPDADNILKLVLDALNGIAFKDDCQIERASVAKLSRTAHGEQPFIHIHVIYSRETEERR